jgi:hypothetical protein
MTGQIWSAASLRWPRAQAGGWDLAGRRQHQRINDRSLTWSSLRATERASHR